MEPCMSDEQAATLLAIGERLAEWHYAHKKGYKLPTTRRKQPFRPVSTKKKK